MGVIYEHTRVVYIFYIQPMALVLASISSRYQLFEKKDRSSGPGVFKPNTSSETNSTTILIARLQK